MCVGKSCRTKPSARGLHCHLRVGSARLELNQRTPSAWSTACLVVWGHPPPLHTAPSELLPEHCGTRYSHGPTGEQERRWGESDSLVSILVRRLIHHEDPTLMTSAKPNHFPKFSLPNTITWGFGLQHIYFHGYNSAQSRK